MKSRSTGLLVPLLAAAAFLSCAKKAPEPRVTYALGTVCVINLYADGTDEIYNEMAARLVSVERVFSMTLGSSDVAKINMAAGIEPVRVSSEAIQVVKLAAYFAEKSNGAFDPTIGPLSLLWAINTDDARVPAQEEIDALLPLVDYRKIMVDEEASTVFLPEPGMILDLGGIAKGYAPCCRAMSARQSAA